MEFTGAGGGVMVAIAAALWLVYLVPNWLKRGETSRKSWTKRWQLFPEFWPVRN